MFFKRNIEVLQKISRKVIDNILIVLGIIIACNIKNILIRISVVFIIYIVCNLILELYEYNMNKKDEFASILKEIRSEKDTKQRQADIITLLFLPIVQTILTILVAFVIGKL